LQGQIELAGLFRLAMNKLAMNLPPVFVDNRYLKVLVVPQAIVAEVLRDLFAVTDRFSIGVELNADAVSRRDAIFHVEKEFSHGQLSISLISANLARPLRNHASALNRVSDGISWRPLMVRCGSSQASVTRLSMMCT
jgi:hypothetical protein